MNHRKSVFTRSIYYNHGVFSKGFFPTKHYHSSSQSAAAAAPRRTLTSKTPHTLHRANRRRRGDRMMATWPDEEEDEKLTVPSWSPRMTSLARWPTVISAAPKTISPLLPLRSSSVLVSRSGSAPSAQWHSVPSSGKPLSE